MPDNILLRGSHRKFTTELKDTTLETYVQTFSQIRSTESSALKTFKEEDISSPKKTEEVK
jgi:hypothetical protein